MGSVISTIFGILRGAFGWILLAIVVIALLIGIGKFLSPEDELKKADAIVAISGGDTKARTAQAIELYKDGWAPKLIFSGAALDPLSPSNASVMREQAVRGGVPSDDVIIEERATDTAQNALRSISILEELNVETIILVTSSYHQRRASMEFRAAVGDSVEVVNRPVADKDWNNRWWTTPRGWWLAVGELVRIPIIYMRIVL